MTGSNFITCKNNTKWDSLPTCQDIFCPMPNFTGGVLKSKGNCARKAVEQTCTVECVQGGNIIGSIDRINCLNNGKWSNFPDCTCPVPKLNENLVTNGNCQNIQRKMRCNVKCKSGYKIVGADFVLCEDKLAWSRQPTCVKSCPEPELSAHNLKTDGNCSIKFPGDTCHLSCSQGGKIIGNNIITCSNVSMWNVFPRCYCPRPNLAHDLKESRDCSIILPRGRCPLECKSIKSAIIGRNFLTCQNNTTWDSLPVCQNIICPLPNFTRGILKSKAICLKKTVDETCTIECVQGGRIIGGNNRITCLVSGKWSNFPDCTCPVPNLKENLETNGNCQNIQRKMRCNVKCKSGYKIVGADFVLCEDKLAWSRQPTCVKSCPAPGLSSHNLKVNGNCSMKFPGDTCHLNCSQGGKIIGNDNITCLNGSVWSTFPGCYCPRPNLSQDLKESVNCSTIIPNGKCSLTCKRSNWKLVGRDFITCQNNTTWDAIPSCKSPCPNPTFAGDILRLTGNCSGIFPGDSCQVNCKHGGKIVGGTDLIKCLPSSTWGKFPECTCAKPNLYGTNLKTAEDCSNKKPNETCTMDCDERFKIGEVNSIQCLSSSKWGPLPICNVQCLEPKLPNNIKIAPHCKGQIAGYVCTIRCVSHGEEVTITCQKNGTWSTLPQCVVPCPNPSLTNAFLEASSCLNIKIGRNCTVKCTGGRGTIRWHQITEEANIFCDYNGMWNNIPKCTCGPPELSGTGISAARDCKYKRPQDRCVLRCTDSAQNFGPLIGQEYQLVCMNNSQWDTLPICYSKPPCAPLHLVLERKGGILGAAEVDGCANALPGQSCRIACKHGGNIMGTPIVLCNANSQWPPTFPFCTCPLPAIENAHFDTSRNCSGIAPTKICYVKCAPGFGVFKSGLLVEQDWIRCGEHSAWLSLQICSKCDFVSLRLGIVATLSDCKHFSGYMDCAFFCGKIFQFRVTCAHVIGKFSPRPACTCSKIETDQTAFALSAFTIESRDRCRNTRVGEFCVVRCSRDDVLMIGERSIPCLQSLQWGPLPKCSCPRPGFDYIRNLTEGLCDRVFPGGTCTFQCPSTRPLIHTVSCMNNSKWANVVSCDGRPFRAVRSRCPVPFIEGAEPKSLEECGTVGPGETCEIQCKPGYKLISDNEILCTFNLEWVFLQTNSNTFTGMPKCSSGPLYSCSFPDLEMLIPQADCNWRLPGETCSVECVGGGAMKGEPRIKCLTTSSGRFTGWRRLPECACPPLPPIPGADRSSTDSCANIERTGTCTIECEPDLQLFGNPLVQCQVNAQWSPLPSCGSPPPVRCPHPNHPMFTPVPLENCNWKFPGETCFVRCRAGGQILGDSNEIQCMDDGTWAGFPDCTCSPAPWIEGIEVQQLRGCVGILRGQDCKVTCLRGRFQGPNFMKCQLEDAKWYNPPSVCRHSRSRRIFPFRGHIVLRNVKSPLYYSSPSWSGRNKNRWKHRSRNYVPPRRMRRPLYYRRSRLGEAR